ncbi:hypothetical protein TK45_13925 [Bowmanella sp. JS7-9]|nr:hypothetical protein TK45_13925 [Bowmanella sp. JS7-9]
MSTLTTIDGELLIFNSQLNKTSLISAELNEVLNNLQEASEELDTETFNLAISELTKQGLVISTT